MKKRILSLLLSIGLFLPCLIGCVGKKQPSLTLFDGTYSEYIIVTPDRPADHEEWAADELQDRFLQKTDYKLPVYGDWPAESKIPQEIIIGKTNREDVDYTIDREGLARGGFIIAVKDERIIIDAEDSLGMRAAIDHFFSLLEGQTGALQIAQNYNHKVLKAEIGERLEGSKLNYSNVKAMWLSQFDMNKVYCDGGQRSETDFRRLAGAMLDNALGIGINTVIVQVRPNADSMYPSDYYAPSSYVVGEYGKDFSYDPFAIMIELAHERGLSFHAWINPMRAMSTAGIAKLDNKYLLKKWWDGAEKDEYLPTVSSTVYLNVGYADVRQLIVDGAREILEKYDVDGLHMDDYFYPTTADSFDAGAYAANGKGKTLADWRRDNINTLVADLYAATKAVNPDILFGISPAATMEKDFEQLFADIYTWCGKEGYIDYICPQIYFGLEHGSQAFEMNVKKWNDIIKTDSVQMWVGMTLGKAVTGSQGGEDPYAVTEAGKTEWIRNKDVLKRCLEATVKGDKCVGVAYFCYQYFFDPITGAANSYTAAERENFLPVLEVFKWQ